jgi:hypothetical protein
LAYGHFKKKISKIVVNFILSFFTQDCLHSCIQEIENTFRAARDSLATHLQQEQKTTSSSQPAAASSPAAKTANANNNNNSSSNNSKLMETDNQGAVATAADAGSERSSQTPTEVFSVDWLYVA